MDKIRIEKDRISLMTFDFARELALKKIDLADVFRIAKKTGLRYLDVMDIPEKDLETYAALTKRYAVGIYCYMVKCSMLRTEEEIRKCVEKGLQTARMLGAKLLMLVPVDALKDGGKAKRMGREQVHLSMIRGYQIAVETARNSDIQVCIETTPQDFSCCSGTSDCKKILEAVPGLGLIYDTANMLPHGDNPLKYYEELKQYIVYTHLKDIQTGKKSMLDKLTGGEYLPDGTHIQGVLPGEGKIPLKEIISQMAADGYRGNYALEYRRPNGLIIGEEAHLAQVEKAVRFLESEE